jgi:NADH-quinone oxidoreductase subunit J
MGAVMLAGGTVLTPQLPDAARSMEATRGLSHVLFTDYLFAFEAIGALLLIIAVGAVTLSRISGGTHAD